MQSFGNKISDLLFGDSKASLLSLQFLDQLGTSGPIQESTVNQFSKVSQMQSLHDIQQQLQQNLQQYQYVSNSNQQIYNQQNNFALTNCQQQYKHIEPKKLFQAKSQCCCESQIQNGILYPDQSHSQMNNSLNQSHTSKQISKRESYQFQQSNQQMLHNQLNTLRQLQQKGRAQLQQSQYSQQIKQNFQVLFQKVYGIIQQIQLRNQKSELGKSMIKNNLTASSKKMLSLNTRVIELSVGKQNDKLKKKKFNNLQTEFDYNNDLYDEGTSINQHLLTEQSMCPRTPFAGSSRAKPTSLLSLSKQFPSLVSPKANLNTARSDRSSKSKGLTLVSADKKIQKLQKLQAEPDVKKPIKITLMQKKIVHCPKKNIQLSIQPKVDKKTSSFNANNFFSSRRVSTSRII